MENYNPTIGVIFSLTTASMIIIAAFVTAIVMYKETKKMK